MITEIVFNGRVMGLNEKGGLMTMHWSRRATVKENYVWIAKSTRNQNRNYQHPGKVRIELIRHSIGNTKMDYDNLVSTGKLLLDAIKTAGIITDDNTDIIVERSYSQTKALKKESQMTVVRVIDVE